MSTPVTPTLILTIPDIVTPAARQKIDQSLGNIPAGKTGEIEGAVTPVGVQVSAGWKLSERWDAAAWVGRTWSGQNDFGGRVRFSW